jgi:hypothetical protein
MEDLIAGMPLPVPEAEQEKAFRISEKINIVLYVNLKYMGELNG